MTTGGGLTTPPEVPVPPESTDDPRTDAQLLAAHVAGDAEAFDLLIRRRRQRLWAVALRMMGNEHDAADALQDACVSAFRRASGFRGEAEVTTWLHRIVINACLDRKRKQQVRAAEPLPPEPQADEVIVGAAPARDLIEIREERELVTAALSLLNADQRAALILVDMEGYSVDEAAEVLGCAPGTVKSRCARGRARLAPILRNWLERAS